MKQSKVGGHCCTPQFPPGRYGTGTPNQLKYVACNLLQVVGKTPVFKVFNNEKVDTDRLAFNCIDIPRHPACFRLMDGGVWSAPGGAARHTRPQSKGFSPRMHRSECIVRSFKANHSHLDRQPQICLDTKTVRLALDKRTPLRFCSSASFASFLFVFLCVHFLVFSGLEETCAFGHEAHVTIPASRAVSAVLLDTVMEPASVLAFVLLGLKSAKTAHSILSSFQDGPENVKRATADVEGLLLTLVQLSKCRALETEGSEALRATIDVCLGDIDSFVRELTKLTLEPQSSRRTQYWKRLMAMWEEKALSKMSARIASHNSSLGLWLNVLQRYILMLFSVLSLVPENAADVLASNAVLDIPSRLDSVSAQLAAERTVRETHVAVLDRQTTTLQSIDESIARLSNGVETVQAAVQQMSPATIPARLDSMNGELAAARVARKTHDEALKEQKAVLQTVEGGITRLGSGFETMQTSFQTMSSTSASNQAEILASLEQILQKVTGLSLGNQSSSRVVEMQDESTAKLPSDQQADVVKADPCEELTNIITRLCHRVNDNQLQGRIMAGDAKDIVNDLVLALETMSSETFFQANMAPGLVSRGICSTCCKAHWADLRDSLATVHAALVPTRQLRLNDTGKALMWSKPQISDCQTRSDMLDRPISAARIRCIWPKPLGSFCV